MANHEHDFDPVSGYCHRCAFRDDGRLIGPGGAVWQRGRDDVPYFDSTAHLARITQPTKGTEA